MMRGYCRYGYLTWEWAIGLRSYLHPLLFTPAYAILRATSLDTPENVRAAPRITQALLSLAHDAAAAAFVHSHFPHQLAAPACIIYTASWFNAFTHTRMYSNSLESTLHLAALALWPLLHDRSLPEQTEALEKPSQTDSTAKPLHQSPPPTRRMRRAAAICCAGACCVMRPTAIVLFLPVAAAEVVLTCTQTCTPWQRVRRATTFVVDGVLIALLCVAINGVVDRICYQRWLFPPWVNFRTNLVENVSVGYGTHPWHWYTSQGLPAMFASLLPLVLIGLASCAIGAAKRHLNSPHKGEIRAHTPQAPCVGSAHHGNVELPAWPALLAVYGVALYSLVPHKEFRFVLPQFELLLPYAALPLLVAFPEVSSMLSCMPQTLFAHAQHDRGVATNSGLGRVAGAVHHVRARSSSLTRTRHRRSSSSFDRPLHPLAAGSSPSAAQEVASHGQQVNREEWVARRCSRTAFKEGCAAHCSWKRRLVGGLLLLQLPTLLYFGLWHQRGTIAAAEWLSNARIRQVCPCRLLLMGIFMK
jgi:hypothetical protein